MTLPRPRVPLFPYTTLFRSDDRAALGDEVAHERPEVLDPGRVQTVHRLVEDQDRGIREQAAGDAEPLPHAERVRPDLRSEEHTSELQSLTNLVCRLLLEKKK